jgi:hypothetical protein
VCAIRLDPAGAEEQAVRLQAFQSRLPAAAQITLAPLGDRAGIIRLPATGTPIESQDDARALAGALLVQTAALFGVSSETINFQVESSRHRWFLETEVALASPPPWTADRARIIIQLDRRTGVAGIGLVREVLPTAGVCTYGKPVLDVDRVTAAATSLVQLADLGTPGLELDVDGHTVRWVAMMAVSAGLHGRRQGDSPPANFSLLLVDPTTFEVLGHRQRRADFMDDWLMPAQDAQRVFGPPARLHR